MSQRSTQQRLRHWRSCVNPDAAAGSLFHKSDKKRRAPSFPKAPFIVLMAVSRILSQHFASKVLGMIIHLAAIARSAQQPFGGHRPPLQSPRCDDTRGFSGPAALPLFCLAPHGVFRASRITPRAVSSYLAFSPLPVLFSKNRRCVFCDTFRRRNFSIATPAYFTRHAAVWCSDFPPANPANAGLTSDHLPSTH